MVRRLELVLGFIAIAALVSSTVASAHSSVVPDASGDVAATTPPYLDILQAKVTEQVGKGTLYFQMEMADAVPDIPDGFRAWNWAVDIPGGLAFDYVVAVRWCDQQLVATCLSSPAHWEGVLVRNRSASRTFLQTPVPFRIDGATVKAFVDVALVENPTSLNWRAVSRNAPPALTTRDVDAAPQSGNATLER